MQPHFPSIPSNFNRGMDLKNDARFADGNIWSLLSTGQISIEEAYQSYLENLRFVSNEVGLVIQNLDAEKIVITADHGNSFGEWGCFAHGPDRGGAVRKVPWVVTSASDNQTHTPSADISDEQKHHTSVEQKLKNLGYKN